MEFLNSGSVNDMWIDFHTHSFLSDGELVPSELARRATLNGMRALGITDHVDHSNLEMVIQAITNIVEPLRKEILVIVGVELSYVRPASIAPFAARAKKLGAQLVLVHGESPVEPGIPGTNEAALRAEDVDLLAHPGYLTRNEVEIARDNGKFLELTYRKGHCLTNGHVARLACEVGAKLLVNTDCHAIEMIDAEIALNVAKGAGLDDAMARKVVFEHPMELLTRLGLSNEFEK